MQMDSRLFGIPTANKKKATSATRFVLFTKTMQNKKSETKIHT